MLPRSHASLLVLASVASSGCYLSHERAAGADVDAGGPTRFDASTPPLRDGGGRDTAVAPRDAASGERYFTLEEVSPELAVEACRANEGEDALVTVRYALTETCLRTGPVWAAVSADTASVEVVAQVWREHGVPCDPTDAPVERVAHVRGLGGGEHTLRPRGGGPSVRLLVNGAPPPFVCTGPRRPEGAMCDYACECEDGLACVPWRGDAACTGECRRPCNDELDCPPNQHCPPADFTLASLTCAPVLSNPCPDESGCPPGRACVAGPSGPEYCQWDLRLSASIRHPCRDSGECDRGLVCVERAEDGTRACEVLCETAEMRCPIMHECRADSRQPWICEWLGE